MDKYEYKHLVEQIQALIHEGQYADAMDIADQIDWRRVRSVMMLGTISDLYKINGRYEDARDIMLLAYDRNPESRQICYSLCELYIKTGDPVMASEFYKEFEKLAPKNTGRFILKYKLYEAFDTSLEERIEVLEELKKYEYLEKWMYELAYLYHRLGLATKCVENCDELILWFGTGKYVIKAMELKMLHEPLTPQQQLKYEHRFDPDDSWQTDQMVEEESTEEDFDASSEEETGNYTGNYTSGEDVPTETTQEPGSLGETRVFNVDEIRSRMKEQSAEELDIQVKTVDVGEYNTMNLQAEIAAGLKEVLDQDHTNANQAEDAGMVSQMTQTMVLSGDNTQTGLQDPSVSGQFSEEPYMKTGSYEVQENTDVEDDTQSGLYQDADGYFHEMSEDPIADHVMAQMRSENRTELEKEAMTAQPPEPMAKVLTQESDGQIKLVMPESRNLEKQITGQMSIGDIRAEWERMKQESREKQEEEVRQQVLRHTGKMFTQFEEAIRDNILKQMEETDESVYYNADYDLPEETDTKETSAESSAPSSNDEFDWLYGTNAPRQDDVEKAVEVVEETAENATDDAAQSVGTGEDGEAEQPEETIAEGGITNAEQYDLKDPGSELTAEETIGDDQSKEQQESPKEFTDDFSPEFLVDEYNGEAEGNIQELPETDSEKAAIEEGVSEKAAEDQENTGEEQQNQYVAEDEDDWEFFTEDSDEYDWDGSDVNPAERIMSGEFIPDGIKTIEIIAEEPVIDPLQDQLDGSAYIGELDAEPVEEFVEEPEEEPEAEEEPAVEAAEAEYEEEIVEENEEVTAEPEEEPEAEEEPAVEAAEAEYEEENEEENEEVTAEPEAEPEAEEEPAVEAAEAEYEEESVEENEEVTAEPEAEPEAEEEPAAEEAEEEPAVEAAAEEAYDFDEAEEDEWSTGAAQEEEESDAWTADAAAEVNVHPLVQGAVQDSSRDEIQKSIQKSFQENIQVQDGLPLGAENTGVLPSMEEPDLTDGFDDPEQFVWGEDSPDNAEEDIFLPPKPEEVAAKQEAAKAELMKEVAKLTADTAELIALSEVSAERETVEKTITDMTPKKPEAKSDDSDSEEFEELDDDEEEDGEPRQGTGRAMTPEEKELYGSLIQSRSTREQLVKAIDTVSMAAYIGNIIITGEAGMNTFELATKMIAEIRQGDSNFNGKVAKLTGKALNVSNVAETVESLKNGALIIEKVATVSDSAAKDLYKCLQQENYGIVVVLLDTRKNVDRFLKDHEELRPMFNARVDMRPLSAKVLVAFAQQYAREHEFSIDDLGMLALHTKIDEMQTATHVVTKDDVMEIMDDAIYSASRKTISHFFDILFARRYDDEDMIIITEKDFD